VTSVAFDKYVKW